MTDRKPGSAIASRNMGSTCERGRGLPTRGRRFSRLGRGGSRLASSWGRRGVLTFDFNSFASAVARLRESLAGEDGLARRVLLALFMQTGTRAGRRFTAIWTDAGAVSRRLYKVIQTLFSLARVRRVVSHPAEQGCILVGVDAGAGYLHPPTP